MDILNFISWIKGSRIVTSVDPAKTLIPVGLKDDRRDDGYLAGAITVSDLAAQVGAPYKVYSALLNQSGTSAPVPTVLQNNTGVTFSWSYVSTGIYDLNISSAVNLNKVLVLTSIQFFDGPSTNVLLSFAQNLSTSTKLRFRCEVPTGGLNNGLLLNHGLEIKVYS